MYGGNLFYNAMKNNGVKPIIGCEPNIARVVAPKKPRPDQEESEFPSESFWPELRGLSESGATHLEAYTEASITSHASTKSSLRNTAKA